MGDNTSIEWTEATWNPIRGCSRISPGCQHCYAERVAARFNGPGQSYEGLATMENGKARWTGDVRLVEEHLGDPIRWKRPRRIFVNSMSDLFHEKLSDFDIQRVFDVMYNAPHHTFQILTKRARRMHDFLNSHRNWWGEYPQWRHVWLGVSVENQKAADERIPLLLKTPAAVRWLSVEPLLGPVDLCTAGMKINGKLNVHTGERVFVDWVVVGGESGPGARPMHPAWARQIRDDCVTCGVPFFFKQFGEYAPLGSVFDESDCDEEAVVAADESKSIALSFDGRVCWKNEDDPIPAGASPRERWYVMNRVGKKAAGRVLDGRTWDEYPA